jgi:hypothetical protein
MQTVDYGEKAGSYSLWLINKEKDSNKTKKFAGLLI